MTASSNEEGGQSWSERRLGGLRLAEYTAVLAGVAEGFPLDDVLAAEGIFPSAWPAADEAWGEALLDTDDEAALDAHDELLWRARARYARSLSPVDTDLRAWLDLLRGFAGDPEPLAFLARAGLRAADMLRLHRHWSARLADEAALREQALAVLSSPPSPPPRIDAGELVLPGPITARVFPGEELVDDGAGEEEPPHAPRLPPPLFVALPEPRSGAHARRAALHADESGAGNTAEVDPLPREPTLPFAQGVPSSPPSTPRERVPQWPFHARRPERP